LPVNVNQAIEDFIVQELLMLQLGEEKLASELARSSRNHRRDFAKDIAALQARLDMLDAVLDGMHPVADRDFSNAYDDRLYLQGLRCA